MERLAKELYKLINSRIDELRDNIASGHISDIAEYKRQTGQIEGMKATLDLLEQAIANLKKQ